MPALKANAMYEGTYPLVSALSRPVIAKHLVKVAREFGATTVAHGCTGKGNDQVRFEVAITSMAPDMDCISPVRDLALTRDVAIDYAEKICGRYFRYNASAIDACSSPRWRTRACFLVQENHNAKNGLDGRSPPFAYSSTRPDERMRWWAERKTH